MKKVGSTPAIKKRQTSRGARGQKIKKALDKALDPLGPFKEGIFMTLALKYGITFADDKVDTKEIEDLLYIIFERGAQPLIESFKKNLGRSQV